MLKPSRKQIAAIFGAIAMGLLSAGVALAASYQDPGITDTVIKLGGSYPFSGPGSAYGTVSEGAKAYFAVVNAKGGVNGRKIEFDVLDDAYQPSKVVSNVRELVEQDQVFALFNIGGTAHNLGVLDYVTRNKVPHLYLNTGATQLAINPAEHPWTLIGIPAYGTEAATFVLYLKENKPQAKVGILFQNDSFGQDLLDNFEKAAKAQNVQIVAKEGYNPSEPSVDSEVSKLARSGADVFVSFTIPKFAAQGIRKAAELGWHPLQMLTSVSASIELVLKPAGLEASNGLISTAFLKDPDAPQFAADPAVKEYLAAMKQYAPQTDPVDPLPIRGWALAQVMVKALEEMKHPTREALREAAMNMDTEVPMLLPGLRMQTTPSDAFPIKSLYIERFDGTRWNIEGKPIQAGMPR